MCRLSLERRCPCVVRVKTCSEAVRLPNAVVVYTSNIALACVNRVSSTYEREKTSRTVEAKATWRSALRG